LAWRYNLRTLTGEFWWMITVGVPISAKERYLYKFSTPATGEATDYLKPVRRDVPLFDPGQAGRVRPTSSPAAPAPAPDPAPTSYKREIIEKWGTETRDLHERTPLQAGWKDPTKVEIHPRGGGWVPKDKDWSSHGESLQSGLTLAQAAALPKDSPFYVPLETEELEERQQLLTPGSDR